MKTYAFCVASVCVLASGTANALAMTELADDQLSEVRGQDGVYLNIKNFTFKSKDQYGFPALTLTYTMPNDADPLFQDPSKEISSIEYRNISISRTDPADQFADPYQIQVERMTVPTEVRQSSFYTGTENSALALPAEMEVIRLLNPKNIAGEQAWTMSYDWKVTTNVSSATPLGKTHEMGGYIVQGLRMYGGGLDLAPAWSYKNALDVRGTAFGLALNLSIDQVIYRPRGVDSDANGPNLTYSNIQIGRSNSDHTGIDTTLNSDGTRKTWQIADVIQQPGVITTQTDAQGKTTLHMGIDWYRGPDGITDDTRPESFGAISIGNVSIKNAAGTVKDLGAMSIGGIQIRYLDVNFRNPN